MALYKSRERIAAHGEVFTPPWMVESMLDLVKNETERIDSRFLEPACGSGNFLVQVLRRKLAAVELKFGRSEFERRHYALLGLMCIYGVELLADNIAECRTNMLEILADHLEFTESDELYRAAAFVLSVNLVHGDALTMRTSDGQPITFAEWGYLGKGLFQRRDFRLGNMTQIDAGGILDIAMAGTSATLLARKWESALLVNVDNDTLRRIMDNPEAMAAVERIEGWRALGDNVIETIINQSEKVKDLKRKARERDLTAKQERQLTDAEKEFKSKRKLVQEKLIKFATRIPAFMYLTDFRENTLQDVITKLEPELFRTVTGLTVQDFDLLVRLNVFNTELMNQAVFAFRRYEDASLRYTGIESHEDLTHYGLYDTVVGRE